MKKINPPLTHQLVVRITPKMMDDLQADAVANGRTVAQSVRFHLRRRLGLEPGA